MKTWVEKDEWCPDFWAETESGLIVPASLVDEEEKPKALPTGIDLFAGCGGFSCGFVQAGWEVIGAMEWNFAASETYLCNLGAPETVIHFGTTPPPHANRKLKRIYEQFGGKEIVAGEIFENAGKGWISAPERDHERGACSPHVKDDPGGICDIKCAVHAHRLPCRHFWMGDVYDLSGEAMCEALGVTPGEIDCVMGGPPCQGFSLANRNRSPDDPRNNLVFEFARLVCEIKPKTMVMENVPQIASMTTPEGIPIIDALCKILESGNYGEFDALRKALVSHPDARIAYKGAKSQVTEKNRKIDKQERQQPEDELSLFE